MLIVGACLYFRAYAKLAKSNDSAAPRTDLSTKMLIGNFSILKFPTLMLHALMRQPVWRFQCLPD
jgi:hypothetical protein